MTTMQIQQAICLLDDADPEVRIQAAVDLGTWRADEAAEPLVARLGVEPSHAIRETLTWAVLRMTDAALPYLHAALGSDRWLARMQVAHVLSKLGDRETAVGGLFPGHLLPGIADPIDAVASRTWWAAGQTHHPDVAEALVAQLARGDSELRNSLSIALDQLGGPAIAPLVRSLRTSENPEARRHAADTLGLIGSPGADPAALALVEALDDRASVVRLAALNALGQLSVPLADTAIETALTSPEHRLAGLAQRWHDRRHRAAPARRRRSSAPHRADLTGRANGPSAGGGPSGTGLTEGVVAAADGVIVELRCATAFVADGTTLMRLARRIADLAATSPHATRDQLLGARLDDGTVSVALETLAAAVGEPIVLGAVEHLPGRTFSYLHPTPNGTPPRVGVLVGFAGGVGSETLAAKVALQVAVCAPAYLSAGDVPPAVWHDLREDALTAARAAGTSPARLERAVASRLAAYATECVLLEQVSVTDPGGTVDDLLYGRGVRITGFRRVEVGRPDPR